MRRTVRPGPGSRILTDMRRQDHHDALCAARTVTGLDSTRLQLEAAPREDPPALRPRLQLHATSNPRLAAGAPMPGDDLVRCHRCFPDDAA
ncbi:MAG: hypothetical protein M0Z40_18605 [Actinomycetota bacterium]|nr:hypothetical protein [Actinomycetota bacterium]